ncbi:Gfo/Idh/MocA family protein [Evansella halocellulosilytica]|uniref:Gfo/Idh/MocA family protein n=1 Tax=Evansella halocellulosilytica TaxID=2011013 RepID=UPI000BB85CBF|nr:Gfo/Idh/MocA family oxidoreductase [Evansella halocellulosilytica]
MINVGIIGTGAISSLHIEAYKTFSNTCKVVGLCDIYPEKAQEKCEQFANEAAVYDDYQDLLAREDIDLVSICTPPYTHSKMAVDALNAGKHVIVEKPMASSLKECDEMIKAAKNNDKLLSVIAQNRFREPIMKLKKLLDSNKIGTIVHAQVDSHWWRGYSYYDLWWRGTWEKEGGGCTLNHAVHHIDILRWYLGMPKEVTAVASNTVHDNAEVEDLSIGILKYENGSLAQVTSSVVHHGEEQQLIFQGEKARISVPWKVTASSALENGFPERNEKLEAELEKAYEEQDSLNFEGHEGQINNMLNAIQGKEEILSDGRDGRETLELIMAIYQSASEGKTVPLPLTSESPFYTREGILKNATYYFEKKNSIDNFSENQITTGKLENK